MSMITEQVEYLIKLSNKHSFESNIPTLQRACKEAANTISVLSEKLQAANMERSTAYYNGGWMPVKERLPELVSREAAIDAIYKNHMNGEEGVKQDLENLHGSAACFSETLQDAVESIEELPTVPAIPIPDNATNGDVLKRLLYGKAIITEFIHDVNISVNNTVVGQFDMEWWNSPYKRGDTE